MFTAHSYDFPHSHTVYLYSGVWNNNNYNNNNDDDDEWLKNKGLAQFPANSDVQQTIMQEGEGDHVYFDDKRLVVFLTGMEKPPTFCHLSIGSR